MNIRRRLISLFSNQASSMLQKEDVDLSQPDIKHEANSVAAELENPGSEDDANKDGSEIELMIDRQLVIVDIGCRWGFAEKFIENADCFRLYGFDPDREECEKLARHYDNEDISIVPVGLAGSSGMRTLYVTQEPACSSLLKPDPGLTENYPSLHCARLVSTVEVETTTLDDWAQENCVQFIDHIKIDTQGTELEILEGSVDVLKNVRSLEVEVEFNPIYLNQPLFADVDTFLRRNGFMLWKLTNQVHYSRTEMAEELLGQDSVFYDEKYQVQHDMYGGQLYWANAHYVSSNVLHPDENSEEQKLRDIALFQALNMPDVVNNLPGLVNKVGVD